MSVFLAAFTGIRTGIPLMGQDSKTLIEKTGGLGEG